jgi:hypothetical protein
LDSDAAYIVINEEIPMDAFDHPSLEIDYPAHDEAISSDHYTFRVSATVALIEAEVSIDRGPWRACRHACGLWWLDWSDCAPGAHQIAARGTAQDGRILNSTLRRFSVSDRK